MPRQVSLGLHDIVDLLLCRMVLVHAARREVTHKDTRACTLKLTDRLSSATYSYASESSNDISTYESVL